MRKPIVENDYKVSPSNGEIIIEGADCGKTYEIWKRVLSAKKNPCDLLHLQSH